MSGDASDSLSLDALREVVACYFEGAHQVHFERFGKGHLNDSFRVRRAGAEDCFLQRINSYVFPKPAQVMANLERVLAALGQNADAVAWSPLELLRTRDDAAFVQDDEGEFWRVYRYVVGSETHERADDDELAVAAAKAFGEFQRMLLELEPDALYDTIEHFHDTPRRWRRFEEVVAADPVGRLGDAAAWIERFRAYENVAPILVSGLESGELPRRVVHNDAKLTNILFARGTTKPLSIVDLDTVIAGSSLYDFGDMVRTMSHHATEDHRDVESVVIDRSLFRGLCVGFCEAASDFLQAREVELLLDSGRVMTLQQGIRFLTDHLEGDPYFGAKRPGHNLDRAKLQLSVLDGLTEARDELLEIAAQTAKSTSTGPAFRRP